MIHHGDLFDVLPTLEAESIEACVCDPPYEISFMNRKWDGSGVAFNVETWREVYRVLKPGAFLCAFGGTRTFHRMTCAIEDAGFEIRDCCSWLYGSGFPKSLDVSKAIDKHGGHNIAWFGPWLRQERARRGITQGELAAHFPSKTGARTGCVANWELGYNLPTPEQFNTLCRVMNLPFDSIQAAEREVISETQSSYGYQRDGSRWDKGHDVTAPATDAAKHWQGWGTALKPSWEPIILARKPFKGTVAQNVLTYGCGSININGCRIKSHGERGESRSGKAHEKWCPLYQLHGVRENNAQVDLEHQERQMASDVWSEVPGQADDGSRQSEVSGPLGRQADGLLLCATGPLGQRNAGDGSSGSSGSHGTPSGDGQITGALADGARAYPPHQREQVGQSTGELGADGLGGTFSGASGGASTLGCVGGRESGAKGCTCGGADSEELGRWPANVCLDDHAAALLDAQSGELVSGARSRTDPRKSQCMAGGPFGGGPCEASEGGASRFFYVAKPSREERDYGCDALALRTPGEMTDRLEGSAGLNNPRAGAGRTGGGRNLHPTVKPVELMRWLVKLVTPPNGTVLDPFTGSGTTGMACRYEQRQFIGIEREADYVRIAEARIAAVAPLFHNSPDVKQADPQVSLWEDTDPAA